MLLSNLLTNKDIRQSIRYFSWPEPVLKLVRTGDAGTLQQILRVIVNITFDDQCRYLLQKNNAVSLIKHAVANITDSSIQTISNTALKNLNAPVSGALQKEVDNKLATGGVEQISATHAHQQGKSDIDLKGLDDVLSSYGSSATTRKPTATTTKPKQVQMDDLNDLLQGYDSTPSYSAPKKADPPKPTNTYKAPAKSSNYDDLDDLLDPPKPSNTYKAQPKPTNTYKAPTKSNDYDDLDDLLNPKSTNTYKAPAKSTGYDDLDDLLNGVGSKPYQSSKSPGYKDDLDDIDDLLANLKW